MAEACTSSLDIIRGIVADLPAIREAAASKKLVRLPFPGVLGQVPQRLFAQGDLREVAVKLAQLSGQFRAAGLGSISSNADVQQRQGGSDVENLKLQNLKSQQSSIKNEISRSRAVPTKQLDKITLPTEDEYAASEQGQREALPSDEHARTLALLRFELHSRKAALRKVADLQTQRRTVASRREDSLAFLTGLPAQLAAIKAAAAPLGQQLGAPALPAPHAPTALAQQPAALRNVFAALHALRGSQLPAVCLPAACATVTSVQVCPTDASLTAVQGIAVPAAYGALLQQLRRESDARRASAGPAPKLLRAAAASDKGTGASQAATSVQLPSTVQGIFEPHAYCVRAQVQCSAPDGGSGSATLDFLWLPHVAGVFVAAANGDTLENLFPGDMGLSLPITPSAPSAGGALQGLPLPPGLRARPFVWAQAMAGLAVQGAVGVWLPSDSEASGAAAASCIAPTARSVVAAVATRALRNAAAAAAVQALQGCCNASGAHGIIPASSAAQGAVRRLRTAAQGLLAAAPGGAGSLPASARLEAVRLLPGAEVAPALAQAVQLALDGAKMDLRSDLAAALASATAWQRPARAGEHGGEGGSSDAALTSAMRQDEWVVTDDEATDEGQSGNAAHSAATSAARADDGSDSALVQLLHCSMVLPCTLRVQVLLICGPAFPAQAPIVLLLAAPATSGAPTVVSQHNGAASIPQRLALDDLTHEMNNSMPRIFGEAGASVQDVLRLLQSALPLAVEAATSSAGPEAATSAWRSLLKGRARRLRLLSLLSGA